LEKKGIEKNLLAKKFIKSIIYSKESIEINLLFSPRENKKASDEIGGKSVRNMKTGSPGRARTYNLLVTN